MAAVLLPTLVMAQTAPVKSLEVKGVIDSVTVYRGQALVARTIDVPAPGGLREVVITDLPIQVVPSSLFAESMDGAQVRSVLYRERAVSQDVREEVRKLDDQIRALSDEILANQRAAQTSAEQKAYLDKLEGFVAPSAQVELTKGVLNADTLKQLTAYQFEQRAKIAADELKLTKDGRDLREKLDIVNRNRAELTRGSGKTVREAVVFAQVPEKGAKLRLRYLVNNANWFPSYNVRGDQGAKQVTLEYNASIQQMSGEDWTDVQMILSTATPSLVAMAPTLDPMTLALSPRSTGQQSDAPVAAGDYKAQRGVLEQQKKDANRDRNNYNLGNALSINGAIANGSAQVQTEFDDRLNDLANKTQWLEIVARDVRDKDGKFGIAGETVSVTYQMVNRTSLPSREDTQLIQIAAIPVTAEFYKLAAPVLSSYVYDQATLTNDSKMVLLAGPVASYVSGQFVGGGQIPTVAIGETFNVGFGIDSSLRAGRELVEKLETTQGGNKVMTFNYRLTVENFGAKEAVVRLTDRLPITKDNDIKISLVSSSKPVSEDAVYAKNEKKNGIQRWDLPVPAQAIAAKAVSVDYQFKLEFDRQMNLSGLPLASKK